jgi:glycosyltransferase involved in cell wall biosynthesis
MIYTFDLMHKKIIICSNVLWSITNFRKDLIIALINSGYAVTVIGSNESFSDNLSSELKGLDINIIMVPLDRSGHNLLKEIIYFLRLLQVFKKAKPDVVLLFSVKPNIYGSLVCRILKIQYINTINGLGSGIIHNNIISSLLRRLYLISLKASCKVLFQNNDDKAYFLEKKLISEEKAGYVPGSGINIEKYNMTDRKLGTKRTFLFVGRILKDKGICEYIEAIKELKDKYSFDVEFLLAGIIDNSNPSGVSMDEINHWESLYIVKFLGKTDNIIEYFDKTDIIVLPSYREGLSRLLLEAASCGKPIITTNVPGCKDLVEEGITGFLCEPKDSKSLMEAMVRALNTSNSDLSKFGINGRNMVKTKFSDKIVNKVYLDQIENCLKKKY